MSTPKKPLLKRLEKWAADRCIHLLYSLVNRGGPRLTSSLGRIMGLLYFTLIKSHRKMAIANLRRAFPALSAREATQLARQVCIHFGKSALEFLRIPAMSMDEVLHRVEFVGEDNLRAAFTPGKGVLLITAHFGNWELMGTRLAREGYPFDAIARDSELPSTTAIINRIRESSGLRVFPRGELLPAIRALKDNRILAILPDQHDYDGIFVDFFGQPAKTAIGPATIALRTGALLLPVFTFRQLDDTIRVVFQPPFAAESTGNKEEDVRALTQRIMGLIEAAIREAPDQWLWFHNRWKSKPVVEVTEEAASVKQ
jgi:KDO2-lipid IV(A) lauroyltransferase